MDALQAKHCRLLITSTAERYFKPCIFQEEEISLILPPNRNQDQDLAPSTGKGEDLDRVLNVVWCVCADVRRSLTDSSVRKRKQIKSTLNIMFCHVWQRWWNVCVLSERLGTRGFLEAGFQFFCCFSPHLLFLHFGCSRSPPGTFSWTLGRLPCP